MQDGARTPSVAGGDTCLGEGGYGTATAPMSEAQVVERASQMTAEGKQKASATTFEGILQELGEEAAEKIRKLVGISHLLCNS